MAKHEEFCACLSQRDHSRDTNKSTMLTFVAIEHILFFANDTAATHLGRYHAVLQRLLDYRSRPSKEKIGCDFHYTGIPFGFVGKIPNPFAPANESRQYVVKEKRNQQCDQGKWRQPKHPIGQIVQPSFVLYGDSQMQSVADDHEHRNKNPHGTPFCEQRDPSW